MASATIGTNRFDYAFDTIGNRDWSSAGATTNAYIANNLNQYTAISAKLGLSAPLRETNPTYDADGNLLADGMFRYTYDAENRLISATSLGQTNGAIRVVNTYDHNNRRTKKTVQRFSVSDNDLQEPGNPPAPPAAGTWDPIETHVYVWDGNNIALETITFKDGTSRTCEYFWGPDLSGSEQGAGGVGGLLAVSMDGAFHIPLYDHNGNIVRYISENGATSAAYVYDPFGSVLESSGPLADDFTFGFSTKPLDRETGLVAYQRRFYRPDLGRWLNRDPIEEESGGVNLYRFVNGNPTSTIDGLGLSCSQRGSPHPLPTETWHIDKIDFDYLSQSHLVYIAGIVVHWRLKGEVVCCCSGRLAKRVVYKWHTRSFSFENDGGPVTGWDPTYKGTFDIPIPTSAVEAIADILASFAENMAGSRFVLTPEDISRLKEAVKNSRPRQNDGVWPSNPCK